MKQKRVYIILAALLCSLQAWAWPGMPMPKLHIDGRWLVDEKGNHVNLHGFGQTYSPWFNEKGSKWSNYDVNACLAYNKGLIDDILDKAGWKMTYLRLHMDPYWSNEPGVQFEGGESNIVAFSSSRFKKYLDEVFIPMAEYAISKGLYVVMRPPGVCPENIEIGGQYHKYLKLIWKTVAAHERLANNPYIMFELANEPINIKGTDGTYGSGQDKYYENLTKFFQEVVDVMRDKGCNNILWVPGLGYQSQYAGFAKYPIKGDNIGYAVHVYPGWYGSDAIEPSHELGGSFGGGYESFAAGWKAQIEPCAAIAPILVTEMDWLPSKYEASWGKSITGKMLGAGFGANFKLLADRTGNVSWMIFTGPELLAKFHGRQSSSSVPMDMYNDPEGCMWSAYYWYREYAGEAVPDVKNVGLYFSPREEEASDEKTIVTGGTASAALIADRGLGFDFNVSGDLDVSIDNKAILKWEDNQFVAMKPGETTATVKYEINGKKESCNIKFISTPFPMSGAYFNPNIWETGTYDETTKEFSTGQYGFAGWKYNAGLDISGYNYLICQMETPGDNGLSLRLFDQNNYWTDPSMHDFNGEKRMVVDLKNMVSNEGRKLDPSHIYIIGFWTLGGGKHRIQKIFLANDPNATAVEGIAEDNCADGPVYNLQGIRVANSISDVTTHGIYIVNGRKIKK